MVRAHRTTVLFFRPCAASPAVRTRSSRAFARPRAATRRTCCCSTARIWSPTRSPPASRSTTPPSRPTRSSAPDDRSRSSTRARRARASTSSTVVGAGHGRAQPGAIAEPDRRARRAPGRRRRRVCTPATRRSSSIAVDVQDPGNVGAIVRVAEAAGATGVVAAGASADPFGWKALRGSMGSALRLPIAVAPRSTHAVDDARRARLPHRRHRAARRPVARSTPTSTRPLAHPDRRRRRRARRRRRRRRRRARDDSDAAAGRVAERRGHRGADRLRGAPSAHAQFANS